MFCLTGNTKRQLGILSHTKKEQSGKTGVQCRSLQQKQGEYMVYSPLHRNSKAHFPYTMLDYSLAQTRLTNLCLTV